MEAGISNHVWSLEEIIELLKHTPMKLKFKFQSKEKNGSGLLSFWVSVFRLNVPCLRHDKTESKAAKRCDATGAQRVSGRYQPF